MKILCISDKIDPLIYSDNIKKRYKDIDLIISAGDLNYKYHEYIISSLNKELLYVHGNHDRHEARVRKFNEPYHGQLLDGKVVYLKKFDLIVAGLGGSMHYNDGEYQYSEKEMKHQISKITSKLLYNKIKYGRYLDILVTHASPLGIHDISHDLCHTGFDCFNSFMDVFSPAYLLHGHMHLTDFNQRPITTYANTKIINVYQSYILEINKNV